MPIQFFDGIKDGEIVLRDATPEEEATLLDAIAATQPDPAVQRRMLVREVHAAREARQAAIDAHTEAMAAWHAGTPTQAVSDRLKETLTARSAASQRLYEAAAAVRAFDEAARA